MTPPPQRLLLVDDEPDLQQLLVFNLGAAGFAVEAVSTGAAGIEAALRERPAVVILDLMLPDIPGTEVCRRLRSEDKLDEVGILMLTARGDEYDRVLGFEVGADDYVIKPFSLRELMLRIRAVLRRKAPADASSMVPSVYGRLRVDMEGHRVWVDEQEVVLTALEFRLLTTLIARRGRVQTRDALLGDVWGVQPGLTTRTVDTHVRRLRKKLGEVADYVQTLRGVGYRFTTDLRERDEEP